MRLILSIILLIAAGAGFVVYIIPTYGEIQELRAQQSEYETVLSNARKLEEKRDELLKRWRAFDPGDIARLETMLPKSPENMKFILELNAAASAETTGLLLQNVKVLDDEATAARKAGAQGQAQVAVANLPYGTIGLEFTVVGPYGSFVDFLDKLETSLRIIDINKVSFIAVDDKANYQYTVGVKTYWVK